LLHADFSTLRRGEIWLVELDPAIGREQNKTRPALVITPHRAGSLVETVTIVPITSTHRDGIFSRVPIAPPEGGLSLPGDILTEHVRTISTLRMLKRLGFASGKTVERVRATLRALLGL
jgi:mRNA interferase MazF